MIVGSEMLRLRSVEIAEERAQGDFVHALLHGRLSNPQELIARAAHYDFDISGRYGVIVARQVGVAGSPESQLKMQQLTRSAAALLARNGAPALVTIVGDVLAVVMQTESGALQRGSEQVAEFARVLHRELSRLDKRTLTVTYGRPMNGATRIVDSYREARVALGVCERLLITDVSGYGELRVFGALLELAGSQHGQAFAREVLEPLRTAARKGGGDLEEAVVAYVESGGNLNAAARKLSLHRNTMLYKLDRASRALGMDLRTCRGPVHVLARVPDRAAGRRAVGRRARGHRPAAEAVRGYGAGSSPTYVPTSPTTATAALTTNSTSRPFDGITRATQAAPRADPANRIRLNRPRAAPDRPAGERVADVATGVCTSATPTPLSSISAPTQRCRYRNRPGTRPSSTWPTTRVSSPLRTTHRGPYRSVSRPDTGARTAIAAGNVNTTSPATAVAGPALAREVQRHRDEAGAQAEHLREDRDAAAQEARLDDQVAGDERVGAVRRRPGEQRQAARRPTTASDTGYARGTSGIATSVAAAISRAEPEVRAPGAAPVQRDAPRPGSRGTHRSVATSTSSAPGTIGAKIQRQPTQAATSPPTGGPTAWPMPLTAAQNPRARARRSG